MFGDVPSYDDLAIVITCSIIERTPRRIHDLSGLSWDADGVGGGAPAPAPRPARPRRRPRRDAPADVRRSRATRRPRELGGVYVDPETLRWFCAACWDADVDRVAAIVGRSG